MYLKVLSILICFDLIKQILTINQDNLNYNDALITFVTNTEKILIISYNNIDCINCKLTEIGQTKQNSNLTTRFNTYYPTYQFYVLNRQNNTFICKEYLSNKFHLNENSSYIFNINYEQNKCELINLNTQSSLKLYLPLIITSSVLLIINISYYIIKYLFKNFFIKTSNTYAINNDLGTPILNDGNSTYVLTEQDLTNRNRELTNNRIKCIDVLRGMSLSIMIFVNYGAGGYSFLDHAVWNGLNLADTVFPIFIFLMGLSLPLSMKSQLKKNIQSNGLIEIRPISILIKIFKRTFLLFFFGLITSNSSSIYLSNIRIMGVLQRFSISYLSCALIELLYLHLNNYSYLNINLDWNTTTSSYSKYELLKSKFKEIFMYPIQWLIVILYIITWLLLTLLLPIDGCPTGYLGPGGLHENGTHFNCTGGSAGYIDRLLLGQNHIYQEPTCKQIYKNEIPYDPEGLLGCLTSCVLTYIGVMTGHVIIHYQTNLKRISRFIFYALLFGLIGLIMCKFSINDGWIPINKNLWSLSFVFVLASISLFLLSVLYIFIDIFKLYSGTPFLYLGRNSITVYICHIVFGNYFPLFKVDDLHSYQLIINIYWIMIWCLVAWLMNYKKLFINF